MTEVPDRERMLDFERQAEEAYARLYHAPSYDEKDLKDDALFYLARAVEVAHVLGLAEDEQRLRARIENIRGVWDSQFRGNFR